MKTDPVPTFPKLAAPGAGLPAIELFVARLIFGHFRRTASRPQVRGLFTEERDTILQLAASCGPAEGARQVLIKRLRGLEDSSRYWSVYMTLEHLRIVNAAVTGCIRSLSNGKIPPGEASTAAVKPAPGIDAGVIEEFSRGADELLAVTASINDLTTVERYPHPWFGPLNAAGWHAMAAFHMRLHRRQIESIRSQLLLAR